MATESFSVAEITSGEAVSLVSWEARLHGPIGNSSAKLRSHW